ncbi:MULTISPECIES: conjugal transfer protein TrbF [Sphingomonadales]|jgi:type IV secretory pathway TrbF-like protein|uniref:Type IV secretion system protein VirB5 n=3 Tax=Sphingomonadaceae TaxID=41297 RepID=A0A7W6DLU0_9SPHN|nr:MULTISPECIES: conjugal transfer protein TrbF [Sphingomonadales]MAF63975.1 conjugal transfer protein TrbF [Blastomonas sp.]MBA4087951.1 conjugal transfer protein TrbF [Novosphingobium sp.]MBQ94997.1 conjugal transfer protein TrbF [Actinomycetota bacterium]MBU7588211.1 conjugal transfer protein TrbF [Sphingopyxis terrae]MEA3391249.1 conjugal transfer protein TrbF [Pseudomonadota bacterium]ODU68183.1 MAG: conjugal transfer protein TrbF [Novosphingobium sp. SCN 66-18]PKP88387.1 MAG: conjugal |tara:strand:- start:1282 stop:2124 length:843 start_codon:yes stop_codon:yes gene_type:complete
MKFRRALQRYGRTPEPETPYQRAGQLWDERIGSARAQAKNWRLMAFGGLFLTTGLSGALVWQSMQSRVVPYVVEVDALGQAQAVAPAAKDYRPTDPQIAWFLGRFITGVRARSLDPVLMRENWLSAYDFATERASLFLGEYARTSNPFADVGRKTVSVQVTSVVRASDTSFQVKWTEQQYERGSLASTSRWTAMLTVKIKPPRLADVLRKNPLGLYVDAIDWSRELETPQDRPPSPQPSAVPDPAQSLPVAPPTDIPLGSPLDPTLAQPAAAPSPERTDQ